MSIVYPKEFVYQFPDAKLSEPYAVSFLDPERKHKIKLNLINNGVCVITGMLTPDECESYIDYTIANMQVINTNLSYKENDFTDMKRKWRDANNLATIHSS